MNAYDFDWTIFHPDSSYAFFKSCLKRFPRVVMREPGRKIKAVFSYITGGDSADAAPMKEAFFSFLAYIPEVETVVDDFWKENEKNIASDNGEAIVIAAGEAKTSGSHEKQPAETALWRGRSA